MGVLGISGSLRAGSYNRALLRAARDLAPAGMEIVDSTCASCPSTTATSRPPGIPSP
jgi:chromate reductase